MYIYLNICEYMYKLDYSVNSKCWLTLECCVIWFQIRPKMLSKQTTVCAFPWDQMCFLCDPVAVNRIRATGTRYLDTESFPEALWGTSPFNVDQNPPKVLPHVFKTTHWDFSLELNRIVLRINLFSNIFTV